MALGWVGADAALPLPEVHPASVSVALVDVHDGLTLPVALLPLADGSARMALTQLDGVVVLLDRDGVRSEPLLDLRHRITGRAGEQGLFSVAIEPAERAAERNAERVIVAAFTERDSGDVVVAAYPLDDRAWSADGERETLLLRIPMPEPFHHGGQVAFGPDGMLWVSVGDGEAANHHLRLEPPTAQDLTNLRGTLLRIDPLPTGSEPGAAAYAVPPDNPFVDDRTRDAAGAATEIWAYGFRNPWKFTFHPDSGDVLLVDVGSDRWEEVNLVRAGANHGWPSREGPECQAFPDGPGLVDPDCPDRSFAEPVVALAHLALDPHGAQAITGGTVVVDPELPALRGLYLFGDFVTGRLWSLDLSDGRLELLLDTARPLTHVTTGPAGEVLLISIDGVMARLVAGTP